MSKSYTSQMCIDPGAEKIYYGRTNHGGHAERIAVRETACVPMPDGLSYEEGAACACGTGTAYDALKRLDLSGRDTFAIYGQGPVGLSAALFGVATGARVIENEEGKGVHSRGAVSVIYLGMGLMMNKVVVPRDIQELIRKMQPVLKKKIRASLSF